jgi:hypothetical protein
MFDLVSDGYRSLLGNSFFLFEAKPSGYPDPPEHYSQRIALSYNLASDSSKTLVYTYVSSIDSTGAHGEPIVVGLNMGGGSALIPGVDKVTFASWQGKRVGWWQYWGGLFIHTVIVTTQMQINMQLFVATKSANSETPTLTMTGDAGQEVVVGDNIGGLGAESSRVATGASLFQFSVYDKSYTEKYALVFGYSKDMGRTYRYESMHLTWSQGYYDWNLLDDVIGGTPSHVGPYQNAGGIRPASGSCSPYHDPVWIEEVDWMGANYIVFRGPNNVTDIHLLENYELDTTLGTRIVYPHPRYTWTRSLLLDDADGTLYQGYMKDLTNGNVKCVVGWQNVGGWNWKITKEFLGLPDNTGVQLFREFLHVGYDPTYLCSGFGAADPSLLLKHTQGGTFAPIYEAGASAKIEISKGTPIEAYHEVGTSASRSAFIYQNSSPEVEGWSEITAESPVHDLRVFDIIDGASFTIAEGNVGDGGRWVGIATTDGIKAFPTSLAGDSVLVANFGQPVSNFETTNLNGNPYLFVMTSGVEGSGAGFWQRGQNEVSFSNYSDGLPSEHVTIIRVDDRI